MRITRSRRRTASFKRAVARRRFGRRQDMNAQVLSGGGPRRLDSGEDENDSSQCLAVHLILLVSLLPPAGSPYAPATGRGFRYQNRA
jgi:hypothetical protein